MKLRAIGNKVLVKKAFLKPVSMTTTIVIPLESKSGHPGYIMGGEVLSVGEECKFVKRGDLVLLDASLMVLSLGQDEDEFFIYEANVLAVVDDLEDWMVDAEVITGDKKRVKVVQ